MGCRTRGKGLVLIISLSHRRACRDRKRIGAFERRRGGARLRLHSDGRTFVAQASVACAEDDRKDADLRGSRGFQDGAGDKVEAFGVRQVRFP